MRQSYKPGWAPTLLRQKGLIHFDENAGSGVNKSMAEIAAENRATEAEAKLKETYDRLAKLEAGSGGGGSKPLSSAQVAKWGELLDLPENAELKAQFAKQIVGPELEKQQASIAKIQREAQVAKLQAKYGIDDDTAALYMTADDPALLEKQAAGLKKDADAGGVAGAGTGAAASKPPAAQVPVYPGLEKSGMSPEQWALSNFEQAYDAGAGKGSLPA